MRDLKHALEVRFKKHFPNKRLLAVQLNGFSHKAYYDSGTAASKIECYEYSHYTHNDNDNMFTGIGHYSYQNNATEILYLKPNER